MVIWTEGLILGEAISFICIILKNSLYFSEPYFPS